MSERADRILRTVVALDTLSDLPRTGWLLRGVRPCESIADHSFGVVLITMMLVDALREDGIAIDGERALRMAIVHDAPEAATGDLPNPSKTPALDAALGELEESIAARVLTAASLASWRELETGTTLEARVVKAADKLHMMAKAALYQQRRGASLDEFWTNPKTFDDRGIDVVRELFEAIAARVGRALPAR